MVGGPPCQSFSSANQRRIIDDPRNELYKYYRQNSYKSTDENKTLSSEEKQILIRENIHEIAYLVRKINALKEEIYNNIEDIDDEHFDLMDALINNEIDPYSVIRACTNTTDNS